MKSNAAPQMFGVDFSHAMLVRASRKAFGSSVHWTEADALHLPFPDARFQLVTSAFGFRNLANYDAGLREIYRVLAPGGELGILDFGEPKGIIGILYSFYFRRVLPAIGTVISGVRGPYAYLPASVHRFPAPQEMLERMRSAGFQRVSWTPYTFGIAGLYRAAK
jgi:demethylmenaquinone methyltransferase/2-methoxy-6-polyprenyl-1,4-benzoquinol methylase